MKVEVYNIRRDGNELCGTIEWNGEMYILDPSDNLALIGVLSHQLITEDGEGIDQNDPESFLENLSKCYRSSYTFCTEPT